MIFRRCKAAVLGAFGVVALALIGCGGSGGGDSSTGSASTRGTLAVHMSDGADPTITSLNLSLTRIEANVDGEWLSVPLQRTTVDLMDLVKNDVVIASGEVPTGRYNQVRVFFDGATVTDAEGTHDVTIPSGAQTGLKLNVDYQINSNEVTALLLDFNVDKSLHKTGSGKYMLQPVIPVVVKVLSGTITGTTRYSNGSLAPYTNVRAFYMGGPNYPIGTEVNSTNTLSDGTFKIWALLPGNYRLEMENVDGETIETATVLDVAVTANSNTEIGTIDLD